jgi:Bifunctional DNA primase/polymerase, N-terminal/D5 N terminal like
MEAATHTIRFAKHYLEKGLRPLPLPPGEKAPKIPDWPKFRIAEDEIEQYFPHGSNVGIILGTPSRIIDIDLDCCESIEHADKYLPATGWVFGHASKLRSHRIYRCQQDAAIPTRRFADPITCAVVVELRGDGGQTVFPPSIHPSGEDYRFDPADNGLGLVEVKYAVIYGNVSKLSARCLVARYGDESATDDEATWLPSLANAPEKVQDTVHEQTANAQKPASGRPNGPGAFTDRGRAYAEAALRKECEAVAGTGEGSRNDRLNAAALKLGQLVAGGLLSESEVRTGLEDAARQCGLPPREAKATIASGLRVGMRDPRGRPNNGNGGGCGDPGTAKPHDGGQNGHAGPDDAESIPAVQYSEDGLALRFVEYHGDSLRYAAPWGKWLKWTGAHWQHETTLAAYDLARKVCQTTRQWFEVNKPPPPPHLAKAKTFAAVEIISRSDRRVAATTDQWDSDKELFNTPGGAVILSKEENK